MTPLNAFVKNWLAFFITRMVFWRFLVALMIFNCLGKF